MDDDQLLEAYLNTLEKNEGTAGGDNVTDMSTRPYGVKDLLGVNPKEYTDDPRGLAKAVAQKHIDELKRMKLDWDNLPTSMKFNALDLQYNMGNLNTKAPSYYKNIKNGNYAAAIKESLDTIGAYDPKRKGERPTKGIALRRAMFYNMAAQDLELPTITNVNARNLNNKNKSARVTYTLSDDSKIPIKYTTLSLHSRTKPGTAEVVNTDVGVILRPTPTKKEEYTPAETVEVEPKPEEVYTLDYKGKIPDIGEDVPVPPDAPDEQVFEKPIRPKPVAPTRPKPAIAEKDVAPETTDAIPVATPEPEEKGFLSKAYDYLFSNDESPEVIQKRNETREELLLGLDKLKTPQMNEGGLSTKEQMDTMMSPDDMMMPQEPVTKEKLKSAAKELGTFAAEMIPGVSEEMAMQRVEKALAEGDNVGAGFEATAGMLGVIPGVGDAAARVVRALKPKKTVKAYKLFTRGEDGNLYPLFVDADTPVKKGEFINAVIPDTAFKAGNGKYYVPSKGTGGKKGTGDSIKIPNDEVRQKLIEAGMLPKGSKAKTVKAVAMRPGWHAGDSPSAPHIGNEYKGQKYRSEDQVWAEVEMPADIDWQDAANKNASLVKSGDRKGLINVKEAEITDKLPSGGYYRYKTNPNMQGNWLISGEMKVNRILEPDEVKRLNKEAGTEDLPTIDELKSRDMAKGGVTMDDYQFAELELNKRQNFAEGGMSQQMEMFADGGLNDEGGMVDQESGNEVPPGSLREEVRDDIPAQLSEGEFVFPADVVRYWGLDTLMKMRQKAKEGLARMEAMGQMGNADEATIPDDTPFDIDDLELLDDSEQDELNFNVGGVVPPTVNQYGTYTTPSQFSSVTTQPVPPVQPPVQQPVIGQPPVVSTNLTPGFTAPTTGITPVTSTGGGNVGFTDLMPTTTGRYDEMVEYVNPETNERRMIPFVNGKPIYPIPAGFVRAEDTDTGTTQPVTETTPQDDGGGGRDDSFDDGGDSNIFADEAYYYDETEAYEGAIMSGKTEEEARAIAKKARRDSVLDQSIFGRVIDGVKSGLGDFSLKSMFDGLDSLLDFENPFTQDMARSVGLGNFDTYMKASNQTTDAFAGSEAFGLNNPDLRSASFNQGRFQVAAITPGAIAEALVKEFSSGTKATYNDMATAGNSAMKQALGSLGFANRTQLMDQSQASLVGKAMSAAHAASRKGQDVQAAVSAVLNSKEGRAVQDKAYATIKDAYSAKVGRQVSDAEFADDMSSKAATYASRLKTEFSDAAIGTDAEKSFRANVITSRDPVTGERKAVKNKGRAVLSRQGQARKTAIQNALAQTTAIADNARARQSGPSDAQVAASVAAGYRSQPKSYAPDYSGYGEDPGFDGGGGGGSQDNDRSDSDTSNNESGSGGGMGGGYGSVDDGWGGGD